ncbi:MAG TPA: EthD family reductase [Terriglobales bacterium]|nr:EthD family reductase [Terriglobales bacterium]
MLKFMVVLHRRPGMTPAEFRRHLEQIHGPLAKNLPGLRKYTQNYPSSDPERDSPAWDAIVELYFDDRAAMEAAWASPQGAASDADLPLFADLTRTTWSVVEEVTVLR